jgi:hypothetical protein
MHKDIANCLLDLNSTAVLVLAAERGLIGGLACAMEECRCPEGRKHFEPKRGWNRWAPSADRYPVPGRDGGLYTTDNVRLSHFQCNRAEGGKVGGKYIRSNSTRALMSIAATARQTGSKHSEETKIKMSESAKNAHASNPRTRKVRPPKPSAEETRVKKSESATKHRATPSGKAQLAKAVSASKTPAAKAKRLDTWARKRAERSTC